jgi:hypothetical protein
MALYGNHLNRRKKQQFRKNSWKNFSVVDDSCEIPLIIDNRENNSAESV